MSHPYDGYLTVHQRQDILIPVVSNRFVHDQCVHLLALIEKPTTTAAERNALHKAALLISQTEAERARQRRELAATGGGVE